VIVADVVDVDFGDDAPIVGGAAGDGSDEGPPPDSPASRARALNPIPPQQQRVGPPTETPKRRRTVLRWSIAAAVVLILLVGGLFATRWFVLRQYYVAVADTGEIGIFQGVRGSFLGVKLNREIEGSCPVDTPGCEMITVNDLKPGARSTVENGIIGLQNQQAAEDVIRRLRTDQVLPACNSGSTSTTTAPPTTNPPATTTHTAGATTAPAHTAPPIGAGITPTTVPTAGPPAGTSTPKSPVPGVDCRKAGN
jgi:protein phosphatase